MDERLGIVIPAYKVRYLEDLLDSLCAQTCSNFQTLVVDDDSPEDVASICQRYAAKLNLRYVRCSPNLGRTDLVAHWNRAVRESGEPWITVPGDDDLLDPTCVEAFYDELSQHGDRYDVYSFSAREIDGDGKTIREVPSQDINGAGQFLMRRFAGKLVPAPVCYVFSMQAFDRAGGFVSFPRGWHSDDASFALFAARTGIKSIADSFVSWRVHSQNLSADGGANAAQSNAVASQRFLHWLHENAGALALTDHDLATIVNQVAWRMYAPAKGQPLVSWCSTAWEGSGLLKHFGGKSRLRHLWRYGRARWSS